MANTFSSSAHWRDSARNPRFFMVDARAAFPIFLFLMHISVWILEHFGFTVPVFLRWLRLFLAGPVKSSTPWWRN